jgi:O-antigen ligase
MMQLLLVIYFISITKISYKLIETIFDTVIVWALFQLPFGLMQISKGIDMSGTLTAHHGYLGTMLIIPFFLSLYKLYDSLKTKCHKLTSVYYGIASVLILYMIFGTGCRSSLVGLSASLFLFIINFILKKDLKKVLTVLVLFTILIFISIKFTPAANIIDKTFHSSETNGNIDISSLSRLLIWKYTLLNFIQFPLITKIIGIGMGTFAFLEQHFVLWAGSSKFSGAHLNVLHILVETGILGLACFLMMFLYKIISLYYLRYYRLAQMTILMTLALLFSGVSQETFWFQSSFGTIYLFYITILTFVFKQLNNLSLTAVKEKCNY